MPNFRGVALNTQMKQTQALADSLSTLITRGNKEYLKRWEQGYEISNDWVEFNGVDNPLCMSIWSGITPMPDTGMWLTGKASSQIMLKNYHTMLSHIMKTFWWEFPMRYPRTIARPTGHPMINGRLSNDYANGMLRLSDSLFLKYAMHIEGEKNVWDVQYKGFNISGKFPINNTLRLPFPVMWLEAPKGGYTLKPPKKRLHNKITKNIDPIYEKKIGGILLMEVELTPVNLLAGCSRTASLVKRKDAQGREHEKPSHGLCFSNMVMAYPQHAYRFEDKAYNPTKMWGNLVHKRSRKYPYDVYHTDYEMNMLMQAITMMDGNPRLLKTLGLGNDPIDIGTFLQMKFTAMMELTKPPAWWYERIITTSYPNVISSLWQPGRADCSPVTNLSTGTFFTYGDELDKTPSDKEFQDTMRAYQQGVIHCKYDGWTDKLRTFNSDEYDDLTILPQWHTKIRDFPKKGVTIEGMLVARQMNHELGEMDKETAYAGLEEHATPILEEARKDKHIKKIMKQHERETNMSDYISFVEGGAYAAVSKMQAHRGRMSYASNSTSLLLPQFMVTGINEKSIRTDKGTQAWLDTDEYPADGGEETISKSELFAGIMMNKPPTLFNTGSMKLQYTSMRILRDFFGMSEYGYTPFQTLLSTENKAYNPLAKKNRENEQRKNAMNTQNFANTAVLNGLRYDYVGTEIRTRIDSVFDFMEENLTDDEMEERFPDFDYRNDTKGLFLKDKRTIVLEEERQRGQVVDSMSEGSGFHECWEVDGKDTDALIGRMMNNPPNNPFDVFNFISDDGIQKRHLLSLVLGKIFLADKQGTQISYDALVQRNGKQPRWSDSDLIEEKEDLSHILQFGYAQSPFSTFSAFPLALCQALSESYANTLPISSVKSFKPRKLMLATVYGIDGNVLMQLPIPNFDSKQWGGYAYGEDTIKHLYDFYDAIWRCEDKGDNAWEVAFNTLTEFNEQTGKEEDSLPFDEAAIAMFIEPIVLTKYGRENPPIELEEKVPRFDNDEGMIEGVSLNMEKKVRELYLESHKHFAKENLNLIAGLLQFINRPEVKVDARPFAVKRGSRIRGKGNKHHKERLNKDETHLKSKNHILRRTGIVKRILMLRDITNKGGKVKAHWVTGHNRNQPYRSEGVIREIWIDGHERGYGALTSRPRMKLQDKRGEEE